MDQSSILERQYEETIAHETKISWNGQRHTNLSSDND
jgi:hypothetical protein